jgi:hypothetical protein
LCFSLSLDGLDEFSSGLCQDPGLPHHLARVVARDQFSGRDHDLLHDVRNAIGLMDHFHIVTVSIIAKKLDRFKIESEASTFESNEVQKKELKLRYLAILDMIEEIVESSSDVSGGLSELTE